jgi:SAM-dependent methyltransferase
MGKGQSAMTARASGVLACPICGGADKWPLRHNRDLKIEGENAPVGPQIAYEWWLCRTCGSGYPSFMSDLKLLASLWESNRDISEPDRSREDAIWQYRKKISEKGAQRSYRFFSPLQAKQSGRFLDIGCGLGETVKLFAGHGWDALGVDVDPTMRRFHEAIGIKSKIGQIETLNLARDFDIIHTAHAIYFVTNIRRFIASLRDLLARDGLLCVVLADFLASDDPGLPGYAHSFYPTSSSMSYLLALEGFQVISCKKMSGSIFIAARLADGPLPTVHPWLIRLGHESKPLRYALFGKPLTALKSAVKKALSMARP